MDSFDRHNFRPAYALQKRQLTYNLLSLDVDDRLPPERELSSLRVVQPETRVY